ncbi:MULTISPECIES: copper resistance CopC family protein [Solibacillus]|uniref:copper resistance CopC family protein n=1 Tax=Solibacillus TaxID=648800 RepID=UPI00203F85DB|nr:copper resistance protein CopC [Solibacillus isronensis]MCM3721232.1 copper resistance protein CopC [Solibacillus isronensis]
MRKQLLLSFVATFLLFVPGAFAHTHLVSTNPAEGESVNENIKTIDLTFEGKIEEGSLFKVIASDGKEMAIHSISVNDGVLSGIMLDPLPNNTYTVEWDSISEDGHPLSGSFSFAVNAPAETKKEEDNAADTTEKIANDVDSLVDTLKDETNSDDNDEGSFWTLVIVITLIVLVLAVITMYSYKRWLVKKTKK